MNRRDSDSFWMFSRRTHRNPTAAPRNYDIAISQRTADGP